MKHYDVVLFQMTMIILSNMLSWVLGYKKGIRARDEI